MLTALVIDASPLARQQVTGLLELTGWTVHEAADAADARWLEPAIAADLVVTAATVPGAASGAALLTELRAAGSTARFLVVTPEPTDDERAAARAAGALACLAGPVDRSALLDLVRRRTGSAETFALTDAEDLHDADLDADLADRLQETYADVLPHRFSAIDSGARAGDPRAVADAAYTLAGTSGQFGHDQVAALCQAIAADARRGVLAHALVSRLAGLAGVDRRVACRAFSGPDRRTAPDLHATRRAADLAQRRRLAAAAVSMGGAFDLGGLPSAADAAVGRMSARRRGDV